MPIYPRHDIIHIHIPKTGGTALAQLFAELEDFVPDVHHLFGVLLEDGRWFELQHLTAQEAQRRTDGAAPHLRQIAVVRNPYQRLISEFEWRGAHCGAAASPDITVFDSFREFVLALPPDLDVGWDRYISGADRALANLLIHARPQWHYLAAADGSMDPRVERLRFEDFPDAARTMLADIGVDGSALGCPRPRRLTEYFTTETIEWANRLYARDFALLGYPVVHRVIGR